MRQQPFTYLLPGQQWPGLESFFISFNYILHFHFFCPMQVARPVETPLYTPSPSKFVGRRASSGQALEHAQALNKNPFWDSHRVSQGPRSAQQQQQFASHSSLRSMPPPTSFQFQRNLHTPEQPLPQQPLPQQQQPQYGSTRVGPSQAKQQQQQQQRAQHPPTSFAWEDESRAFSSSRSLPRSPISVPAQSKRKQA